MSQNKKKNQKYKRKRRHNALFSCVNPLRHNYVFRNFSWAKKRHLIKKRNKLVCFFLYNRLSLYFSLLLYVILWILVIWLSCCNLWHTLSEMLKVSVTMIFLIKYLMHYIRNKYFIRGKKVNKPMELIPQKDLLLEGIEMFKKWSLLLFCWLCSFIKLNPDFSYYRQIVSLLAETLHLTVWCLGHAEG